MAQILATQQDIEMVLGRPLLAEQAFQIDERIEYVSELLRNRIRDLDARMALDPSDPRWISASLVKGVVANVIIRCLNNPEGVSSSSQALGPESYTRAFRDGNGRVMAGLYLTGDDVADLLVSPSTGSVGACTVPVALGRSMTYGVGRRW